MLKIAVLASGSGSNLQSIIDEIKAGNIPAEISLVLSDQPNAFALTRAKEAGLNTSVLLAKNFNSRSEYDLELVKILQAAQVELVVLAGYMRLVSKELLRAFPNRVVNIHPALLPAFPGLHGQEQAFNYGVKVAGCTVHFVDEGMDTGPIIAQAAVNVLDTDDAEALAARILVEEHKIYPRVIKLFAENRLEVKGRKVYIKDC